MPRKGFSARRSVSPVTICVPCPLTANSRNLSSFGSRQACICISTSTHSASRVSAARKDRTSSSCTYRRNRFRLKTSWSSARTAKEISTLPSRKALFSAWRGFESGRSKALTKTFVSNTQRNYAPFRRESSISGVSPRSFAFRPTSSSTCCNDRVSPAASSRSHRPSSACIFRFSSGAAESYARAVCGSSGIVIVAFAMALTFPHSTPKSTAATLPLLDSCRGGRRLFLIPL
jgi:hypothetical protein